MRLPAQRNEMGFISGNAITPSPLTGRGEGEKRNRPADNNSSFPARLPSRITLKHAVTRLIAGGLLFLVASAANATAPVGATPGSFAVSPSGAAIYSIPIFVPPGTNGMQPQLSLNYNSQSGNGLLGVGWSIGGLSVIHRCGATIAIDGVKGGVNYDANDKFCLDGERLISIGGGEYRTQHESWQKIVAVGGTASDPGSFTVTAKDGTIQYYGATTDSRIEAQGKTVARLWALNRVQDRNGNYFTITYQEDNTNGDYRPDRIDYTGNGSIQPYNSVVFGYVEPQASRPDIVPYYEGGSVIQTLKRVTNITSYAGAQIVRDYRPAYDNYGAADRTRLTSITECGSDGVCLPPTALTYQQGNSGFSTDPDIGSYSSAMTWQSGGNHWGDVNGDGRSDFVYLQGSTSNWRVMLSNGTSLGADNIWGNNTQGIKWDTGDEPHLLDVNGDGMADVVYYQAGTGATWRVLLSTGSSFGSDATPWAITTYGIDSYGGRHQFFLVDLDGDGKLDIVYLQAGTATWRACLSMQGSGNSLGQDVVLGTQSYGTVSAGGYHAHYWADVNGDGKADLIYQQDGTSTWRAMISNGTSLGSDLPWGSNIQGIKWDTGDEPRLADVNADGKADLVYYQAGTGATWRVLLSTGSSFATDNVWGTTTQGISSYGGRHQFFFVDVDGDGKPDIVYLQDGTATWRAALSSQGGNNTLGLDVVLGTQSYGTVSSGGYLAHYWADVNGDGKNDLAYLRDGTTTFKAGFSPSPAPDLLVNITDGLGAMTLVNYKPLTDSTVYQRIDAQYPYRAIQDATHVVSDFYRSNGIGGLNTTIYQYSGLKRHITADANLGFLTTQATTQAYDAEGQLITTAVYNVYNQILDGTEGTLVSSQMSVNGVTVKTTTNSWYPVSLGANRTYAQLTSTNEKTYEPNNPVGGPVTNIDTSYLNYDLYGNPQNIVVNFNDGWTKTTDNTYDNYVASWILGKLKSSKVTVTAPGQSAYRESSFTYDPATGRLLTEVIEPNRSAFTLTTTYGYDPFGNRTTKTVYGADLLPQTRIVETLIYDSRGQFVSTRKNALNQSVNFTYDARTGAVATATDPNGIVTTYAYNDGFGRKTRESRPGSPTTDIYYICWDGSVPASGVKCPTPTGPAMTAVRTVTSGAGENYVYSDILGRTVQANTQGLYGNWIYKQTTYDNLGRVSKVSHPYFASATPHCTTYSYDNLGRVRTVTEPGPSTTDCNNTSGGRVTTTDYNGLTTTVTSPPTAASPNGQVRTTVKNSQRLVATVTDYAGTTTYTYDPFGNLTRVVKSYDVGADTTMGYDIRGRKTSMYDPDMGTWSYKYNTLGELIEQKDAIGQTNGRVITMTYDVLGRMQARVLPNGEGTSNWTYGTVVPEIGKLKTVSNPNATETYAYNSLSQVSSVTTSISGTTYTTGYTYDTNGRVLTVTYPETGFKLYNVYDPYGYLIEVRKDTATGFRYWLAVSADAHGRLAWETLGNGLVSMRAYDHATGDLQTINTYTFGGPSVQNSTFAFDALDNLTARSWSDGTTTRSETFGYDNLNRLTAVTGPVNRGYYYYPNGNISLKTGVGLYNYPTNGIRPHAVSSLAFIGVSFTYDDNGNMLTGNGRTMTYTSFNKPKTMANASGTTTLTYDANYNRLVKTAPGGTTTYIGKLYERVTSGSATTQKHYIYAGSNLVGVYSMLSNGTSNTRYFHTDHLGSVEVITDESHAVVQRLSYDTFGKRRNPDGTDASTITAQTTRGFTRHEHDDELALVNMNAREYDPNLGRFLTADTVVPGALDSQAYNRYSYANNNPLSFTDPTGNWSLKKAVKKVFKVTKKIVDPFELRDNRYVRIAAAAVAAYYTAGAASSWFLSSAGGSAFAASAFASGNIAYAYSVQTAIYLGGGIVGGAVGGATAGGVICGNDCARQGAKGGAVSGGIFAGADLASQDWNSFGQITSRATAGGLSANAQGGQFDQGFRFSFATGSAGFLYDQAVGYGATWASGGAAVPKQAPGYPVKGANNVLFARPVVDPNSWFSEGGIISRALNVIPSGNALAGGHDAIMAAIEDWGGRSAYRIFNLPMIPAAAALTTPALFDGPVGSTTYQCMRHDCGY